MPPRLCGNLYRQLKTDLGIEPGGAEFDANNNENRGERAFATRVNQERLAKADFCDGHFTVSRASVDAAIHRNFLERLDRVRRFLPARAVRARHWIASLFRSPGV